MRAGLLGGLVAWLGFTLPSAVALILVRATACGGVGTAERGWLHGLKIVAVAVVAQAVWGMARSLAPGQASARPSRSLAAILALAVPSRSARSLVDRRRPA